MVDYWILERTIIDAAQKNYSIWYLDDNHAYQIGIPDPKQSPNACYFEASGDKTVWDDMRAKTPWFLPNSPVKFTKSKMRPGQYYHRMARPHAYRPDDSIGMYPGNQMDNEIIAVSITQLLALTSNLQGICKTVHPHADNFNAYGHEIRNLLILACTEAEAQWTGILKANGYACARPTTNDYVKLVVPMRLNEFSVRFPSFPWLNPVKPFGNWRANGSPTADLEWYAAYNAVKHDREHEFSKGNLKHTFDAIAACYILLVAQFGSSFKGPHHHSDLIFFETMAQPDWPTEELYLYPDAYALDGTGSSEWFPTQFPFS